LSNSDDQINEMLQKTQFAKPSLNGEDFWFSFNNQKVLAYSLAAELVANGEDVDTAITTAKTFIDTFYKKAIRPHAWER
jgi:hypothetical protein